MEELKKALKEVIEEQGEDKIQMFDCLSWTPDFKVEIYNNDGVTVLYAPGYGYVEVLGLSKKDYQKIYEEFGY